MLLTNIFGPKKEQGPGGFETLRNASLRNLYLRIKHWRDKATGKAASTEETEMNAKILLKL
jgi:hypothetical protein